MGIFAMLVRSIISYTIFLTSRTIVRTGIGAIENLKLNLKLHRCSNCWRLFSGEIEICDFCYKEVAPLYGSFQSYDRDKYQEREGIEKQVYNDTRKFKFEPASSQKIRVNHGSNSRRTK